ncbi:MAG: hypothetical protein GX333_01000 [Syntrophomonadaceae bacterium]|nr:hypothetical protein [Syntrophomonadaceae bacterium]
MGNYDKRLIPVMIAILIVAFAGGSWYAKGSQKHTNNEELILLTENEELNNIDIEEVASEIVVFVNGAVVNPGIYKLPEGSRLYEAIDKAGGILAEADAKNAPMARIIEDEETIYIPFVGEETELSAINIGANTSSTSGKVNINKANAAELGTLNGIGPALSQRIIDYRASNGAFKDISEIKNVSGIGEKKYEAIKDYISVK